MRDYIQRHTRINLAVGILSWLSLFVVSLTQWSYLVQIHLLILFGVAILTPLSLRLVLPISRHESLSFIAHVILRVQPIIPILTVVAFLLPQGEASGLLAVGWLAQSGLIALLGFMRWAGRSTRTLEELCIDAGLVFTSISGVWFFFYRLSGEFFGFSGVLVPLTSAHFVTIGMGALIIAGLMGRQLRTLGNLTRVYRVIAWISIISPVLVAIGITHTNLISAVSLIEVVGVVLLSTSFIGLAGYYLVKIRQTITHPLANLFLILSALTLFITMALALGYSVGRFTTLFYFAIPDMVQWHGWLNAIGFAGLGILGWSFVQPESVGHAHGIPFSQIRGRWHIGSTFYETIDAVNENAVAHGLVDDLSTFADDDCDIDSLSPDIIRFYEHTDRHKLHVYPIWAESFKYPARFYKWFAKRVNQMNLPLEPEGDDRTIHSRIMKLHDEKDGRESVRAWVRTYAESDEIVYLAGYASHVYKNQRYMNISFPLPLGHITSVLRLQTGDNMLSLSSINTFDTIGDQGVYFVTPLFTLRLPFNEIIDVYDAPLQDTPTTEVFDKTGAVFARHRMWFFGYPFLTLYYTIWKL